MEAGTTAPATISPGLQQRYLDRIGYRGPLDVSADVLRALHRAHMLTVPFENLDIYGGRRPIALDEAGFVHKVAEERRGGYCYELNGAFGALLRSLGYDVSLLSGHTLANGVEGPEFDHMLLRVDLDEPWIADVGFGESSRNPLRLLPDEEQPDGVGRYRLSQNETGWAQWTFAANGKWSELYRFSLAAHALSEFRGMFEYHQVSPASPFTRNTICSLATERGRTTLSGNRLTVVEDGERTIRRLSPEEVSETLRERFGVVLA